MLTAARTAITNEMSVREVESYVKNLGREKKKRPKPDDSKADEVNYVLEAQNRLTAALSRRVTIKQTKGKGKIELEFYDQDDFNVLFDELLKVKKV